MTLDAPQRRRFRIYREFIVTLSLALSALSSLCFMLAMHLLVIAVAPAAAHHTFIVIIVSIASIAIALYASRHGERGLDRSLGAMTAVVMTYVVAALVASFSLSYPGLYTIPFVMFGAYATTNLFSGFSEIGRLFAELPTRETNPEAWSTELIRHHLSGFDRRIGTIRTVILSMISAYSIGAVLAYTTGTDVSPLFLVLGAPFLWTVILLFLYVKVVVRLKSMVVEGHRIEEHHFVEPLVIAGIVGFAVIVVAGLLAADRSILDYSVFITFVERLFGIDSTGDASVGYSGSSGGGSPGAPSPAPPAAMYGRGSGELFDLLRYLVIGGGIVAIVVYLVVARKKLLAAGTHSIPLIARSIRRRRARIRGAFLRFIRFWRMLVHALTAFVGGRDRRRRRATMREGKAVNTADSTDRGDQLARQHERDTILRWYRRLVAWGRKRGDETDSSVTADEYLALIARAHPPHSEAASLIATTFDLACYSGSRVGRSRLHEYISAIREILD